MVYFQKCLMDCLFIQDDFLQDQVSNLKLQNLLLRTSSRILYAILFLFIQASDGLDSALVDMELSSRLQNCSTSISDKVKEYCNTMAENSYFKIISGGKASSCHINTHIAGLTNTNYPSDSLTFSQTVQYVNLAVGLILVVALLVGQGSLKVPKMDFFIKLIFEV